MYISCVILFYYIHNKSFIILFTKFWTQTVITNFYEKVSGNGLAQWLYRKFTGEFALKKYSKQKSKNKII